VIAPVFTLILLVGVPFLLFYLFHLIREIRPSKRVVVLALSPRRNRKPDALVLFPLFVLQKDNYSMFEVEAPDKILCHMKALDIENDEYLCWDAQGRPVQILISDQQVAGLAFSKAEVSLGEAFRRYSDVHGLDADTTGPLEQVWCRLKQAEVIPSRGRGLVARQFRKGRV
jgi:hypothetical protein